MKLLKSSLSFLLFLSISGSVNVYAQGNCPTADNKLINGSFEQADRNGVVGWTFTADNSRRVSFERAQGYQFCGNYYGLLTYDGSGSAKAYQDVTLENETASVTLTIWGGLHDRCNAEFRLIYLNSAGQELEDQKKTVSVTKRVPGLEKYTLTSTVPANAKKVRVEAGMRRTQNQNGVYVKMEAAMLTFEKDGSLPVSLAGFTAKAAENLVELNWQTTSELNAQSFEVLHSTDAASWAVVGEVPARGDHEGIATYRHTHAQALTGKNYYRLKMIDLDGSYEMSRIVSVDYLPARGGELAAYFYPNPSQGKIRVRSQANSVVVYDATGRAVFRSAELEDNGEVDLSHLENGTYVVRWSDEAGRNHMQRLAVFR